MLEALAVFSNAEGHSRPSKLLRNNWDFLCQFSQITFLLGNEHLKLRFHFQSHQISSLRRTKSLITLKQRLCLGVESWFGLVRHTCTLESSLYHGSYHIEHFIQCLTAFSETSIHFLCYTPLRIWLVDLTVVMIKHCPNFIPKLLIASLQPLVPLPVMPFSLNSVFFPLLFTSPICFLMAFTSCLTLCFARASKPKLQPLLKMLFLCLPDFPISWFQAISI